MRERAYAGYVFVAAAAALWGSLSVVVSEVGNADYPYAHESAWTAIENMCLAATDLGLGALTYTPEILRMAGQHALHDLFGLPSKKRIQTIMPIGHINHTKLPPAEKEPNFRRKVFRNGYGKPYPFERHGPA